MHKPHKNLVVWQKAMDFVTYVYRDTRGFPAGEKYGLTAQLRRAAVSIPSNIAEGAARASSTDYARFLTIAIGSVSEVDTQVELSKRLGFMNDDQYDQLDANLVEIDRMLISLRRSIQKRAKESK